MNWKLWPYWVKGGVVAVTLLVIGAFIFSMATGSGLSVPDVFTFLPSIGAHLITPLFCQLRSTTGQWESLGCIPVDLRIAGILFFIQSFILGAIIGYLYGK